MAKYIRLVLMTLFFCGFKFANLVTVSDIVVIGSSVFIYFKMMQSKTHVFAFVAYGLIALIVILNLILNSDNDMNRGVLDGAKYMVFIACAHVLSRYIVEGIGIEQFESEFTKVSAFIAMLAVMQYLIMKYFSMNIFYFISEFSGVVDDNVEGYVRASSILQHYNQLAMALLPGLVISVNNNNRIAVLSIFLGLMSTGSRGAGISAVILALHKVKKRWLLNLILLAIVIFYFRDNIIESEFVSKRMTILMYGEIDGSTYERIMLWDRGLSILGEKWIWGIGLGQTKALLGVDNMESALFTVVLEGGGVCMLLLLAYICRVYYYSQAREFNYSVTIFLLIVNSIFQPFLLWTIIFPMFLIAANVSINLSKASIRK